MDTEKYSHNNYLDSGDTEKDSPKNYLDTGYCYGFS